VKIVVFGQYKTGTTALYYRIKNSLAGEVHGLFEAVEYAEAPGDADRHVLAKVILRAPETPDPRGVSRYETFMPFDRRLYLLRDPRDWLVSGTLFLIQQQREVYEDPERLGHVMTLLAQKESAPRSVPLSRVLAEVLSATPGQSLDALLGWIGRQQAWLARFEADLGEHHRVRYEDLVDDRVAALADYLGFALTGSAEVAPEHDHVPRTRGYGNWRDWFVEEDVDRFRPLFQPYLERHGYPPEWRLAASPVVRPEHCTQYVARVVAKRRARDGG
jgi:hypothetical protein